MRYRFEKAFESAKPKKVCWEKTSFSSEINGKVNIFFDFEKMETSTLITYSCINRVQSAFL